MMLLKPCVMNGKLLSSDVIFCSIKTVRSVKV